MNKYTFVEFVAALESKDFDKIDEAWLVWANKFMNDQKEVFKKCIHAGDCTKQSHTCGLCLIETLLADYKRYYFQEEQWRKDNL